MKEILGRIFLKFFLHLLFYHSLLIHLQQLQIYDAFLISNFPPKVFIVFKNDGEEKEEETTEKLERLKNYLDELKKLVNERNTPPSDSKTESENDSEDSNDDLEWL